MPSFLLLRPEQDWLLAFVPSAKFPRLLCVCAFDRYTEKRFTCIYEHSRFYICCFFQAPHTAHFFCLVCGAGTGARTGHEQE